MCLFKKVRVPLVYAIWPVILIMETPPPPLPQKKKHVCPTLSRILLGPKMCHGLCIGNLFHRKGGTCPDIQNQPLYVLLVGSLRYSYQYSASSWLLNQKHPYLFIQVFSAIQRAEGGCQLDQCVYEMFKIVPTLIEGDYIGEYYKGYYRGC